MLKRIDPSPGILRLTRALTIVLVLAQIIMATPDISSQSDFKLMASSTNKFATDLHQILSRKSTGNVFSSPLSLQVALAMASVGTGDDSESYNEIKRLLKFPDDKSRMLSSYDSLTDVLMNSSDVLKMANRIYVDGKFEVKKEFLDKTSKYFKSSTKQVDFQKNTRDAENEINKWVEDQTNNKIKELIAAGSLSPSTVMILINAIHFKADWKYAFNKADTRKEKFYLDETNTIDVEMMHITGQYNFYHDHNLKAKFLLMPYKGDEFSMLLVLPDSKTGIADLEAAMSSQDFDLTKKLEGLDHSNQVKVEVSLPKFEMTQTHDLVDVLRELGVREIFDTKDANFSNIDPTNSIYVSKVIQKAFVSVDEKGTEAAAATGLTMLMFAAPAAPPPPPFVFYADHPFLCMISLKKTTHQLVLFSGKFVGK